MMHTKLRGPLTRGDQWSSYLLYFRQCIFSSTALSCKHRDVLVSVAIVLACHAGKPVAIRCEGTSVGLWHQTTADQKKEAMTDEILTIVFGCLASVLAIASIVLTCLQLRAHSRQSAHNATPSAMENAHSPMGATCDHNRLAPGRSNRYNILQIMTFDGLVLASVRLCDRRSTCCSLLTN
jgi:hypothetical protein